MNNDDHKRAKRIYAELLSMGTPEALEVLGYVAGVVMASGLRHSPETDEHAAWGAATIRMRDAFWAGHEATKAGYKNRGAS